MAVMGRVIFVFLTFCANLVVCDKISQKVYIDISNSTQCFRRLNATHQIGCTSDIDGNVGVVHFAETDADLDWIINKGPHSPYIVLMTPDNFDKTNVDKLKASNKVNGIMVIHHKNQTVSTEFSPDRSCPNEANGLYKDNPTYGECKSVTWNKPGNNMFFEDFGFPLFALTNQTEVDTIIHDCYEKHNKPINGVPRDYPLCSAELKDRMTAAKDSATCWRRSNLVVNLSPEKYCDPLSDQNIYSLYKPINNTASDVNAEKSIIIAAARLDSLSLFDNLYASAESPVSGFVTVLAAAEALKSVKQDILKINAKDIMFTFFQGEAFDYIGSGRMVYDMMNGDFPHNIKNQKLRKLGLSDIDAFVEVSQIGLGTGENFWIHSDPISRGNTTVDTKVKNISALLESIGNSLDISVTPVTTVQPLPPSSLQTFLRKANISGVVLADHEKEYQNKYYNSRFDQSAYVHATYPPNLPDNETYDYVTSFAKNLHNISTTLARTLYTLSTNNQDNTHINANQQTITHLLYCFLKNTSCELFQQVLEVSKKDDLKKLSSQFTYYVSPNLNPVSHFIRQVLAYYTGDVVVNVTESGKCKGSDEENKLYNFNWVQGPLNNESVREGQCIKSAANYSEALSPAFFIEDYDWLSGEYSSWTESTWAGDAVSVRIFLVPSDTMKAVTLGIGLVIFLVSLPCVFCINRKKDILFKRNGPY